jgi:hypothetical protein
MARVPVVETPCPIAGKGLPAGATEHCTLCERTVHNLDHMSEHERRAFMSGCSGKVCVAYTIKVRVRHRGLAAASLAAIAVVALPAAAGPPAMSPLPGAHDLPDCDELGEVVVTGGVTRGDQAEWADDGKDAPPELPTMEDDGK